VTTATDHPQIVTLDVSGSRTSAIWLGSLGSISALTYSFTCSGGASAMSCILRKPASYRTNAMNPGRITRIICGASVIWDGILDEPQPTSEGWQLTAHGAGTFGDEYMAAWATWAKNPDEAIGNAITRGMRWVNPGVGSPPGMWLGQAADNGSISVTDLLNLVCARGGLAWYVNSRQARNALSVFPLPSAPSRVLIAPSPVARTLGGDINVIWIRYKTLGVPASETGPIKRTRLLYRTTAVTDNDSIAKHGRMETFMDLSSAKGHAADPRFPTVQPGGWLTKEDAQAVGQHVLDRYRRASFAGPFTIGPGQLTNLGGTPVNLAAQTANAAVCRLILTDFGYGGEVLPRAPQFIIGEYTYDVDAMQATVTPMQTIRHDLAGLIAGVTGEPGHGTGAWARR
jgi:hypothetical protein